jgi:two-component system, NarL family, invasion response regulator UvrY
MSRESGPLRLMLVDDHPIVRRGVRDILVGAFPSARIAEVSSGGSAITMLDTDARWDLVILDLTLPDESGIDVLKRIRDRQARLPVLVLSMHAADQFARRAILAGASGYLTKDAADVELVTAVTRVLRGGNYFAADVLENVALSSHPDRQAMPHDLLSDREYQVLIGIASGKTVSELAIELAIGIKTVSTYRARLLEKMGMRNNAELTRYAIRYGLTG